MEKLITFITKLLKGDYYGKVIINVQAGKIVNIEKRESFKLEDL